ncbi:hypothetical protein [Roseobacter sinensis]|uniref:Roadblock/LAMTOR2 domain-containing protein n=1 Tax=Roseobacter sinensis TaxID=2931391 RepID=A0ABT3BHS3_9RHOB|nr:hypothetical protein [Roseobacter sp. WL0113]MCV3273124.1 hypothetical protein [Roseobacter sp. WL0113]
MAVQDRLDDLRARFPGCRIVAFADLSTGLVFAASTAERVGQERLDALCADATQQLDSAATQAVSEHVFQTQLAPAGSISIGSQVVTCVVSLPDRGAEALCMTCDRTVRVVELMRAAADVLSDLCEEA